MRAGTKFVILAGLCATIASRGAHAVETTNTNTPSSAFSTQKQKLSYSIGMNMGSYLKRGGFDVDMDVLVSGIRDAESGAALKMTDAEAREVMTAYQKDMQEKKAAERTKAAEKNKKAGEEFLAANKSKPGIKTHTVTLPDGKTAELQYKVLVEGTGAIPKSNDTVTVNYRGTLLDGKEFDNSSKRPQPSKFAVNRVVPGWTAALQLMKTGSKWELYIPSTLAYQDFGSGPIIEPGSTLIFEIELLSIDEPQQLTSDIIRVPSADELKAGAKIEVLKPEDVEKARAQTNAASKKP